MTQNWVASVTHVFSPNTKHELLPAWNIWFQFPLNPLKFPLTRKSDTKKLGEFAKLQFWNDEIDQNTNFAKVFY